MSGASIYDQLGPGSPADVAAEAADRAAAAADAEREAYWATHPPKPRKPGPAAGFPPAPKVPPIPGGQFRADILRLMESIQTFDGTNRENVEAVMAVKMGAEKNVDSQFTYYGSADEGWGYNFHVTPRDDQPNSTIEIDFFPKRVPGEALVQCTFDTDDFLAELERAGWTIDERYRVDEIKGRFRGFHRTRPDINLRVGALIYVYLPDANAKSGASCVSGMSINAGFLKGDT